MSIKPVAGIQTFVYPNNYALCLATLDFKQIFPKNKTILNTGNTSTTFNPQLASKSNKEDIIIARITNIELNPGLEFSAFYKNDGYTPKKEINRKIYTYNITPVTLSISCEYRTVDYGNLLTLISNIICDFTKAYKLKNELLDIEIRYEINKNFTIPTVNTTDNNPYMFSFNMKINTYMGNVMVEPVIDTLEITHEIANQADQKQPL